jgi:myosin heavy subunit
MGKTISKIKQEFEELVNNSSVFERGLIIRSFSFDVPKKIENFLDKTHDYINEFSIFLFLPFSENEYAYFLEKRGSARGPIHRTPSPPLCYHKGGRCSF